MNKAIGLQLLAYSFLLAGLSLLTHYLAPPLARATLIAGLIGAALCVAWGLRAWLSRSGKSLPILTLIPVNYVMLSQTVMTWGRGGEDLPGQRTAAIVMGSLFLLSMAMLLRIAYAGVLFGGQAVNPTKAGGS